MKGVFKGDHLEFFSGREGSSNFRHMLKNRISGTANIPYKVHSEVKTGIAGIPNVWHS